VILREAGADLAQEYLNEGAYVSAVNLGEVIARLSDLTSDSGEIPRLMGLFRFETVEFSEEDAWRSGRLRFATREAGLSFGDRACLALGLRMGIPVVTADRSWARIDVGVEVVLCR
jgi:PIN domain nuclease of toxin-antitoxin system